MLMRSFLLASLLLAVSSAAHADHSDQVLRVYGPGGPHEVMQECAELYRQRYGVKVAVIRAMPRELERRLGEDGDIYYGGAEYMLVDLVDRNPELLDLQTADELHPRRIGILVRKGNPLGITGVKDLRRPEVELLDVRLENMQRFQGTAPRTGSGIRQVAYTGQQGVAAWRTSEQLDAWVTYRSWHRQLEADTEFIDLSEHPGGLRYTPVAVTNRSDRREEALRFIAFLKSAEAREIFAAHGWF